MKRLLATFAFCLLCSNCGLAFLDDLTGENSKSLVEQFLPLALLGAPQIGIFKVNTDLSKIEEGKNIQFELVLESGAIPANLKVKSNLASLTVNNLVEYTGSISNSKIALTLTALEDENQSDETGTLEFSAAGYSSLTLQVNCKDNDLQRILVSNSPSSLTEGYSGTGKVRLNIKPNANTTVTINSTNTNSLSISPSSLTFTPSNYATEQTVHFFAVEDSNSLSENVSIEFSASGINATSISVPTIDNDISPIFSVASPLSINEGGTSTINVQLNGDPLASRIILLQPSLTGVISISPSSITLDSTNWNNPTPITITALQDTNATNESITLTAGGVGLTSQSLTVNTIDDETLNFIITGTSQLTEGQSGNLQIYLSADPGASTTVTLTSNSSNVNFVPTSFIFNSSNYSTPKSISITTNANDGNEDAEFVTFTATASGVPTFTHNLIILDKDTRIVLSNLPTSLSEGSSSNFQARLSGNPGIPVNVLLASSLPSVSLGIVSIPFTSASYGDQTISITAIEDVDHNSDTPLISLIGSGLASASGSLKVYDNDTTVIFGGVSSVTEGGSGIITIKLSGNPLDSRTLTVSSSDTSHLTLSGSSFTFDSTNFGTNQSITLSALHDINLVQETISVTAVSTPYIVSQSVNITKPEDDSQSLVFTTSNVSVNEGGNINLTLKLAFEPPSNLPITVTIPSNTGISFASGSFNGNYSNTFTSANWNSGFTIPVYGLEDVNTVAENVTITASAGGSPPNMTLGISSVDNDSQAIVIPTSLSISEGSNNTFLTKLLFDPVSPLTVTLTLASSSGLSFSSGSTLLTTTISMTTANYSSGVTTTLYALDDSNNSNETVTLTASASGLSNQTMTASSVDGFPTITSISSAQLGASATITGSNFFISCASNTVTINSQSTTLSSCSGTSLIITVPSSQLNVGNATLTLITTRGTATGNISILYTKPTSDLLAEFLLNGDGINSGTTGNGTLVGNVNSTTNRHGISNSALSFDGNNATYVLMPNINLNNISFSISVWGLKNNSNEMGLLVQNGPHGTNQVLHIRINMANSNLIRFGFYSNDFDIGGVNIQVNQWHFYTFTLDNSNKNACIYIDGILFSCGTLPLSSPYNGSGDFLLATDSLASSPWLGSIDDVRFYNRVLAAWEVNHLYNE